MYAYFNKNCRVVGISVELHHRLVIIKWETYCTEQCTCFTCEPCCSTRHYFRLRNRRHDASVRHWELQQAEEINPREHVMCGIDSAKMVSSIALGVMFAFPISKILFCKYAYLTAF